MRQAGHGTEQRMNTNSAVTFSIRATHELQEGHRGATTMEVDDQEVVREARGGGEAVMKCI